jgi:NADPH2:quinone reductase
MKAIRFDECGDYSKLRLVEVPEPERANDREMLVEITAAGINPIDNGIRFGWIQFAKGPPLVPGVEGVGRVVEPGASELPVGTRVMFTGRYGVFEDGTWRERVWVAPEAAIPVPDNLTDAQAAAVPVAYQTAQHALMAGGFRPGQAVLAPAIGSAVGNAAVQLARAQGAARVITTAGSAEKARRALELGYQDVIDLSARNLRDGVQQITGGAGIDLVVDVLGGDFTRDAVSLLGRNGAVVLVGLVTGMETTINLVNLLTNSGRLIGWQFFNQLEDSPESFKEAYNTFVPLIVSGKIVPHVARTFPLAEAPEAQRFQAEAHPFGKVVLTLP